MRRVRGARFEQDERHTLYREYLAILKAHQPDVFVMENVKGLLSSQLQSRLIFEHMLKDLRDAAGRGSYTLLPFAKSTRGCRNANFAQNNGFDLAPSDFLILSEKYGIPQTRHRVIILGVRSNLFDRVPDFAPPALMEHSHQISVESVLGGLPRLRGGLNTPADSGETWRSALQDICNASWLAKMNSSMGLLVARQIRAVIQTLSLPRYDRGGSFLPYAHVDIAYAPAWYLDNHIGGVCNHETRVHMASDLHRYLFAACFAVVHGKTPKLSTFPRELLPKHDNVSQALAMGYGMFNDRFRVQVRGQPATTITCHLAKDGHYNIHYDPAQCRSLTVREAARIQTFPDNYFFEGPRTQQYVQVGNAVPPLLARQLAGVVADVLRVLSG
jgi:DNA (cytosine-5)-methyltransferase 1